MHAWAIEDELYNFDDSIYKFNAFIFVFKTVTHNIKMNSKIYANKLLFFICNDIKFKKT